MLIFFFKESLVWVRKHLLWTVREKFENCVLKCKLHSQHCFMLHLEHADSQHKFNERGFVFLKLRLLINLQGGEVIYDE